MTLSDDAMNRLRAGIDRVEIPGGRYVVRERLGAGAMGTVWRATDTALDRDVAVKVLNDARDGAAAEARLVREAKTIAQLEHLSIPPVHDVGRLDDGRVYYVMKRVDGTTLAEWVARRPPLAERLRVFLKACDAVAFANDHGVIHRDLKPGNVMLGRFGEVYVMDWGIAKAAAAHDLGAGAASPAPHATQSAPAGTPGYRAPEQRAGGAIGPAADVFALGGILAFLASGIEPDDASEHGAPPTDDRRLRAIIDRARMLAPAQRYASATALAADVARSLDREPVTAYRERPWERAARFVAKNQFVLWLIAGYLALRALVFFFAGH